MIGKHFSKAEEKPMTLDLARFTEDQTQHTAGDRLCSQDYGRGDYNGCTMDTNSFALERKVKNVHCGVSSAVTESVRKIFG